MQKLIFIFSLFFLSLTTIAQPVWKWGRNGGSQINNFNNNTEFPYDMTADKQGNIYVLAKVFGDALHVDGTPVQAYGGKDVLLTSFKCDGTYRWSVVIGGDEYDDEATTVKTDTMGGVYVCGNIIMLPGTPGHFGDTTVANTVKSVYLVKFDSNGVYQWLRMPQADSVDATAHSSVAVDMDVTPDGEVRLLCSLVPGAYVDGGYVVNTTGMHILHYDASGTYVDGLEMDMNITGLSLFHTKMARDQTTGRYYVSGGGYMLPSMVSIGSVVITSAMYAASFNSQGLHLWTQTGVLTDNALSGFFGRPQIDDSGYIYFSGHTALGDNFANTYPCANSFGTSGIALPFIVKMDSNANVIWAANVSSSQSIERALGALRNNDEFVLTGRYNAEVEWPGYAGPHPHHDPTLGADLFVTRFSSHTGEVIKVDTLSSDGFSYESSSSISADGIGGIVIGGFYSSSLYVAGDTLLIAGGNEPDFFVARYAETCDVPQSVVSHSTTSLINIYPNPVTDQLTISSSNELREVVMTNAVGATVWSGYCSRNQVVIDMKTLSSGTYFVKVVNVNGMTKIEKVLKD